MAISSAADKRYGAVSMVLHWTIAVLIVVQIGLGWYMNEVVPDHSPLQDQVQNIHVTIGLTTLILVLIRIGVRLTHPAPPLPRTLALWERVLARASHWLFYILLLVMPLTGWALVSVRHEDIPFWGLAWPAMPVLSHLAKPAAHAVTGQLKHIHIFILVWIALINLALHVAGALKHQFDGSPVLWRMLPFLRQPADAATQPPGRDDQGPLPT
ncbi:MAG TPA: cytochrome b [Caulobacteraceae bacterium]